MKRLGIWLGVGIGLLLLWCLIVEVRRRADVERATTAEMTAFRNLLRQARRELAIHSMEESGKLPELSREFSAAAGRARGSRSAELRAYAEFFKEFVRFNRERAEAATIMKDKVFHNFSTVKRAADLKSRREAVQRLLSASQGLTNQMHGLGRFVRSELDRRKLPAPEVEAAVARFLQELRDDTRFVIELCRIHASYAQNVSRILDLLEMELGNWATRPDGTVLFRKQGAVDTFNVLAENHRKIGVEELALRQQNVR